MFWHQVEYDDLAAINGNIILILHLSLQSLCDLNHIRITEKISLRVLDTQLRLCDLAEWCGTYPVHLVMAISGSMPPDLCHVMARCLKKRWCFWSNVNICYVNCAQARAFIFDTRTDVLVKLSIFLDRKCLWGGLEPPTFGFMPNALTISAVRARHLLSDVVEYWLWRYRYFWSKVNIWYVNCARATAFIFDTWTDVLVKVSKFLRQKMSRPDAECSNHLSCQGQTFAVP